MSFSVLGLDARILKAVQDAGYTEPTPIQAAAIPPILAGHDLIGIAQTGTGKTAAFTLPMLTKLAAQPPGVADFRRQEPLISLYGDAALIIARIGYRRQDGTSVQTRYIDVCVRRDGSWQIVSAQFTRVAATGR